MPKKWTTQEWNAWSNQGQGWNSGGKHNKKGGKGAGKGWKGNGGNGGGGGGGWFAPNMMETVRFGVGLGMLTGTNGDEDGSSKNHDKEKKQSLMEWLCFGSKSHKKKKKDKDSDSESSPSSSSDREKKKEKKRRKKLEKQIEGKIETQVKERAEGLFATMKSEWDSEKTADAKKEEEKKKTVASAQEGDCAVPNSDLQALKGKSAKAYGKFKACSSFDDMHEVCDAMDKDGLLRMMDEMEMETKGLKSRKLHTNKGTLVKNLHREVCKFVRGSRL